MFFHKLQMKFPKERQAQIYTKLLNLFPSLEKKKQRSFLPITNYKIACNKKGLGL